MHSKYVQQAVLDLSYHNNGLYFRDLIYTHAIKGIPKEYLKEYPDNQGIPLNQANQTECSGIPTEISVKQIDLPQLTSNSQANQSEKCTQIWFFVNFGERLLLP